MSVGNLTEEALGSHAAYARYVAETVQAEPSGSIEAIPNELKSVHASIEMLTNPARIEAMKSDIAGQMNDQSGGPEFIDLAERISDVVIETTAQGASTLTITIIDRNLGLLRHEYPKGSGNTFIQVDATGYLWPPIDVNYPRGTDCVWRLCQVNSTTFGGQANITLTFEDRIVSWLREVNYKKGKVAQGLAGQTLMGFIGQLVNGANQYLRGYPLARGGGWQPIRLVPLVARPDPNVAPPVTTPQGASAKAALSRQNPNKTKQGLTKAQQAAMKAAAAAAVEHGRAVAISTLEQQGQTLSQAENTFGGDRP